MKIKNVVKVMNFQALLRMDKALKQADKYRDVGKEITDILSRIMYNKNLILDKKILAPDQDKPALNIYIANDYGFCGNFNASISRQIKHDTDCYKIIIGKKITYNVSGVKAKDLIAEFRTSPDFRIAVTVDMIATGTDIKPLEVVMFMRDVHSELYYEQMKGRGCRRIGNDDLKQVTPNAEVKDRFYLIDAVGVTESKKSASQPLERKRSVSLKKLMEDVAVGKVDDDTLSSLAGRISAIHANIDEVDINRVKEVADGKTLSDIANDILDTVDYDKTCNMTDEQIIEIKDKRKFEGLGKSINHVINGFIQDESKCKIYGNDFLSIWKKCDRKGYHLSGATAEGGTGA